MRAAESARRSEEDDVWAGAAWAPGLLSVVGRDFSQALRSTEFLFPALAINALLALIGPALIATGRVWHLVYLTLGRTGLLIGLLFLLRGRGASGAALAYLLTELVLVVVLVALFVALREVEFVGLVGRMSLFSLPGLALGALSLSLAPTPRGITSVFAAAAVVFGALFALQETDRASLVALARQLRSSLAKAIFDSASHKKENE